MKLGLIITAISAWVSWIGTVTLVILTLYGNVLTVRLWLLSVLIRKLWCALRSLIKLVDVGVRFFVWYPIDYNGCCSSHPGELSILPPLTYLRLISQLSVEERISQLYNLSLWWWTDFVSFLVDHAKCLGFKSFSTIAILPFLSSTFLIFVALLMGRTHDDHREEPLEVQCTGRTLPAWGDAGYINAC